MGRQQHSDQAQYSSSIALLQERFRQLERAKEMREGKDLLRAVCDHEVESLEKNKLFECPELVHPFLGYLHNAPPFGRLQSCEGDSFELSMGLRSSKISKDMDVDTSLHL